MRTSAAAENVLPTSRNTPVPPSGARSMLPTLLGVGPDSEPMLPIEDPVGFGLDKGWDEEVEVEVEEIRPATALEVLFDSMHELSALGSAREGVRFCLDALARALPTRAALAHVLHPATGGYVTVAAQGEVAARAIGALVQGDDWLVRAAACKRGPLVLSLDGGGPRRPLPRHALVDARRALLIAPVMVLGRCVAVIELADPIDGGSFDESAEDALAFVATCLGKLIARCGVVPRRPSIRP